jgi:LuxR family transcriptional regulator, quorum-sensing system regulator CinR
MQSNTAQKRLTSYFNLEADKLISPAAVRLTEKILGLHSDDLVDILRDLAFELSLSHIGIVCFATNRSWDVSLLTSVTTYSKLWQTRYFFRKYGEIDPVIKQGCAAVLPFDWDDLDIDGPNTQRFFLDAIRHGIGNRGLSIPVRGRKTTHSLVSYTGDMSEKDWARFKSSNMQYLQQLSALIDSAANIGLKQPKSDVQLSQREEECLVWAARGKTHQEIADILGIGSGSVKSHLDTSRHKLHCINVAHAVGVALASGAIPSEAVRDSPLRR